MYYESSGSKTFIISFFTALAVSIVVNIIFIFLTQGTETKLGSSIEIPNLKGLNIETARQIVESKGLSFVIEKEIEDPIIEKGKIIFQNPIMGSKIKKGDIVKVIISKGPSSGGRDIIIPILSGLTISQAKVKLNEKNLILGEITMEVSDKPESTIIKTIPEEGEKVPSDFPVNVVLSSGKGQTTVPKIIGLSVPNAKRRLEDVGLVLGYTYTTTDPEYSFDVIIRQNPPAGTFVQKGSKVDITVNVEEE